MFVTFEVEVSKEINYYYNLFISVKRDCSTLFFRNII